MKTLTPIKAIRAKCLDRCCGQSSEVRLCACKDCTLHPYRMGKRPKGIEIVADCTDEEKSVS